MYRLLLISSFLILYSVAASAEKITGKVVNVIDGDTITILDMDTRQQYKVRLSGIDAPEKKQAYGNVSKNTLKSLVLEKIVDVDFHKRDRYGRIVGKVILNDVDVNIEQLKLGMAWFYKKYESELNTEDKLSYQRAHEVAMRSKVGLWLDMKPQSPWDFRKR